MKNSANRITSWFWDNSLSIIFFSLFSISVVAQSIFGFYEYMERLRLHNGEEIPFSEYLTTGHFLDGIFVNWQAAILQLGCLIIFAEVFRQRGASHSRKSSKVHKKHKANSRRFSWLYRNSLSVAFVAMFLIAVVGHLITGTWLQNESRRLTGQAPINVGDFIFTPACWFKMTSTWQAEFFGIALFLVLSIFLRQENSAESKPIESTNSATGETNK